MATIPQNIKAQVVVAPTVGSTAPAPNPTPPAPGPIPGMWRGSL